MKKDANLFGILPFLIFIVIYLGSGIYLELKGIEMAFYKMPAAVAMFIATISAFIFSRKPFNKKIEIFIKGASNYDVILLCLIFLVAGAFSHVAKVMGGVETVSNLGLKYIPYSLLVPGVFLITSFISLSTGTFIGSIITIAPIAFSLSLESRINPALMGGAVLGGAMFGDNLSLISDTTIISSKTQGCKMADVFKGSAFYAFPALILSSLIFYFLSEKVEIRHLIEKDVQLLKVLPYTIVLSLALLGVNVFLVLTSGLILSLIIGLFYKDFTILEAMSLINEGFLSVANIFILVILIGGISSIVEKNGGFDWIALKIKGLVKGRKSGEFAISLLSALLTMATANNTVAILISGPIAKEIASKNKISPSRAASLLDMLAAIIQGILPYGGHIITLVSLSSGALSPFSLMPYLIYQFTLFCLVLLSILGLDIKKLFSICFKKESKLLEKNTA